MDDKEMASRLRNRSFGGYLPTLNAAAADRLDALAAETAALRVERDDLLARNLHGRRALAFADREAEKNENAMTVEIERLRAELARLKGSEPHP